MPLSRSALGGGLAMSAPVLMNLRLIAILTASLLAGYAGDEILNAWWGGDSKIPPAQSLASIEAAPVELAQSEAIPPS
jgi:hypothetical protein